MTTFEEAIARVLLAETDEERIAAKEKLLKAMNQSAAAAHPADDSDTIIRKLLLDLGVPCHIKGYAYLTAALGLVVDNPDYINAIVRELYPSVVKACDTTPSRAERAIRHAIELAWDRCDPDVLAHYFGNTVSPTKGKPTNGEFIARVADVVRQQMKEAR